MFKGNYPLIALLLVTVLSTKFDDIVRINRDVVSSFWANDVSLTINGRQNTIDLIANDLTPIVWSGESVIGAYLNRGRGKALILPKVLVDRVFNTTSCDNICAQWRTVVFGNSSPVTEEATSFFARPSSQRLNTTGIIITDRSTGFDSRQLVQDWEAGTVGPLILQHFNMDISVTNNKLAELAYILGFFFSRTTVNVQTPITRLSYEPIQRLMPYALTLQAWTDNATTVDVYPVRFMPSGDNSLAKLTGKYQLYAESVYNFIQKYDKLLQDNQVNQSKPITSVSHPFTLNFYRNYILQTYSQTMTLISREKLNRLTYNYGVSSGFVERDGLVEPTPGEFLVTFDCKNDINIPTGLDQKPRSIIEYEIVTATNEPMEIGTGAFYDNLSSNDVIRRVPVGRASELTEKNGRFYSPIGGPIVIKPRNFRGRLTIKFKNVYRSPGLDIRDSRTTAIWDNGTFNNTKIRFATLICDVIFFTFEYNVIKNYSSQNLKDICTTLDHVVKSFDNYVGTNVLNRERYHIVFDPQPRYGLAHAGQPIVGPTSWANSLLDLANQYLRQTTQSGYWGHLHEIGHMFQPNYWKFGVFGETTNNVLVLMFQDRYLKMPLSMRMAHPQMYQMNNLFNFINGVTTSTDRVWSGLHFHYHLVPSFGWGIFGNVYNRYMNETNSDSSFDRFTRYLSDETGYNMAPYMYYFRMSDLAKNITAVYQQYAHMPTFKPYDVILNATTERWRETKQYFGFSNDVQVTTELPLKFNPNRNFDRNSAPSPTVDAV